MSYREKQELATLPDHIARLEEEQSNLQAQLNDAAIYRQPDTARQINQRLEELEKGLHQAYDRWQELENLVVPYLDLTGMAGKEIHS